MQDANPESNGEEWRPVVGYERYYEVSSLGLVRRSCDGIRRGIKAGYIMKPKPTGGNYPFVGLYHREKKTTHSTLVHNIVTSAFLGPKPPGIQVNHLDGNKWNSRLDNLEYVTASENQCHANRIGLRVKKLTPEKVRELRAAAEGISFVQLVDRHYSIAG